MELSPKDYVEGDDHPWKLKSPPKGSKFAAVLYYAPWCPHCINFKDTWEHLNKINGIMQLCAFDCAKYDDYYQNRLHLNEMVHGFPSILFYKGTDLLEKYEGPKDPPDVLVKTMLAFCKSNR